MAAETTLATEIAKAAPYVLGAIVGGALTIIGGIAGQFLTHRLTLQREASNYRREKLVQYVELLDADAHWAEKYQSAMCFGTDDGPTEQAPWERASTISNLFLGFGEQEIPFMRGRHAFLTAARAVRIRRLQDVKAGVYPNMGVAQSNAELLEAVVAAHGEYLEAKGKLILETMNLGKRLVPREP